MSINVRGCEAQGGRLLLTNVLDEPEGYGPMGAIGIDRERRTYI